MPQYYDIDDIIAEDKVCYTSPLKVSQNFFGILLLICQGLCFCSKLVPTVFQVAANGVGLFDSSDEMNKVSSIYEISNGGSLTG